VVLSPHLDDAVLSTAGLVAAHPGARVVTAFTGGPTSWAEVSEWDRSCGFRPGEDVMAVRKREDEGALRVLAAAPVWLGLVEGQYTPRPGLLEVRRAVQEALDLLDPAPVVVAVPLGVGHTDHVLLSDAALLVAASGALPQAEWLVYADLPYAEELPDHAEARAAELAARGLVLVPHRPPTEDDRRRKLAAVARYESQVRPLWGQLGRIMAAERYWRLLR
jgi:LmbE family N-acetylglucosaminyl deacetylase